MHRNYIKADVDSFEIGDKRQPELLLSNDNIKYSLKIDHDCYYFYDAEDDDDYTDDAHKVSAVICIHYIKGSINLISDLVLYFFYANSHIS